MSTRVGQPRHFARAMLAVVGVATVLAFTGCRSTKPQTLAEAGEEAAKYAFWQPHLLLTSDTRYRQLEIEIDHVAGTGPTAKELESLQKFFETQCRKPDGVKLRVDAAIPRAEAKGKSHKALAELHLNGPTNTNAAFAYFLFYDGRLTGLPTRNPETYRIPFPGAVFMNRHYMRRWSWIPGTGDLERRALLHEAGHALGLCDNPAHGDRLHCTNRLCLMNARLEVRPLRLFLPGPVVLQREFCADCEADLAAYRAQPSTENLRFLGPYIVRSEPEYHVLASPGFVYVHADRLEDTDLPRLRNMRHTYFRANPNHDGVHLRLDFNNEATARRLMPLLERDPLSEVRDLGAMLREKLP